MLMGGPTRDRPIFRGVIIPCAAVCQRLPLHRGDIRVDSRDIVNGNGLAGQKNAPVYPVYAGDTAAGADIFRVLIKGDAHLIPQAQLPQGRVQLRLGVLAQA